MKWTSFALCFLSVSISQAQVIAKVGSREITQKEFDDKYNLLKAQLLDIPEKKVLLDEMISFEVGVQEAQRRHMDKDPIIKDRMNQELYKGFLERELAPKTAKIAVSEGDMKTYYNTYPEIRVSHIMIEVRPDANPEQKKEARKRAQEIYSAVKKSQRKFEDLVKIYSDDMVSNKVGGDIGWQTRITHYPTLYKAASQLGVGQISPVIETPYGLFIIKLTGRRSYNEADKGLLRLAVQEEKKKKIFDNFMTSLRGKYKIQINKNTL